MVEKEKKEFIEHNPPKLEDVEENEPVQDHYSFPWKGFVIVFGVLITLIVVCVIVILCNGGFDQWSK